MKKYVNLLTIILCFVLVLPAQAQLFGGSIKGRVVGRIATIACATATNNGTLTGGTAASGVNTVISYTGGNGGTHTGQTVASTGVTGLTATLTAGSFANGGGTLTYTITGTPAVAGGTASFAINIGGQTCTLTRTVAAGANPSSGGTAAVSAYACNTASAGTMTAGIPVSGVTQTITATVTTVGTYSITATANGVTFSGAGTFAGTGAQAIVLTATGTPTSGGTFSYTLSTTPGCSFNRDAVCRALVSAVFKEFQCYNLGANTALNSFTYNLATNGSIYQWGRQTDGHEISSSAIISTRATNDQATLPAGVAGKFISDFTDWRSAQTNTLWGDGTTGTNPAKAANDPCPAGFKVPSQAQWGGIFRVSTTSGTPAAATQNTWTWTGNGFMVGPSLFLPAAGNRSYFGDLPPAGTEGNYWSSTVNSSGAYNLTFTSASVLPGDISVRAEGFSVRCISE